MTYILHYYVFLVILQQPTFAHFIFNASQYILDYFLKIQLILNSSSFYTKIVTLFAQVFGTEDNLRLLCSAEYVVSDGTFRVHPDIFSQFYVFHSPYLSKVSPFCSVYYLTNRVIHTLGF